MDHDRVSKLMQIVASTVDFPALAHLRASATAELMALNDGEGKALADKKKADDAKAAQEKAEVDKTIPAIKAEEQKAHDVAEKSRLEREAAARVGQTPPPPTAPSLHGEPNFTHPEPANFDSRQDQGVRIGPPKGSDKAP